MERRIFPCLTMVVLLLVSCQGLHFFSTATQSVPETSLSTPDSSLLLTPSVETQNLTICAGTEPAELFLYNDLSYIKKAILSAIYDGPVDMVDYMLQPVILTKLPSLSDGDAIIDSVPVQEGDQVMDSTGALTNLHEGVTIRPAGCRASACVVSYSGGSIQMDQMRVLFHIRPGVEWADGAPLTAADSVFSYEISRDSETLYGNNGFLTGSVTSSLGTADYVALDELSTQWTGMPGLLDMNYQLNFFIPLPEHQLSAYTMVQLSEANEVLFSPLGWGPYRVTGWEQGKQMTLEANPHYFRAAEGLPYYNKLVIRFVGQDVESNLVSLTSGDCDILLQDTFPVSLTSSIIGQLNSGAFRLYLDPRQVFEYLIFNVAPADTAASAFFANIDMRRAVAACTDRKELVDAIYGGLVPPLDLALPSDHPFLNGADLSYPYDPGTGMTLLEGLGWTDSNNDKVREARDVAGVAEGTPLQFTLTTSDTTLHSQVSGLIAGQLLSCGMSVTVNQSPARDLFFQNANAIFSGRHFDLAETSSSMNVVTFCSLAETKETSSEANGWSGTNLGGYSNLMLDDACAHVKVDLPGTPEYLVSNQTALRLFSEELPVLPLFYETGFTITRQDLAGILTGFGQLSELQNIEAFRPGQ